MACLQLGISTSPLTYHWAVVMEEMEKIALAMSEEVEAEVEAVRCC